VWFKHRAWIPVAWLAALGNLLSVPFAVGEPAHATVHALLAGLFALGARRLMARQQAGALNEQAQQTIDQNEDLRQTIEAMQARLLELEERMDFAERLLVKHRESDRLDAPPP